MKEKEQAKEFANHYADSVFVKASPEAIFAFANDPMNFSSHMNKSQMMMGGGKMETATDKKRGMEAGSHIFMKGNVLGMNLYLDEVVTKINPPAHKEWSTVGDINLLVIGHYTLGFDIENTQGGSNFRVFIDYELPKGSGFILGALFGKIYAKWCVDQMIGGVKNRFFKNVT